MHRHKRQKISAIKSSRMHVIHFIWIQLPVSPITGFFFLCTSSAKYDYAVNECAMNIIKYNETTFAAAAAYVMYEIYTNNLHTIHKHQYDTSFLTLAPCTIMSWSLSTPTSLHSLCSKLLVCDRS